MKSMILFGVSIAILSANTVNYRCTNKNASPIYLKIDDTTVYMMDTYGTHTGNLINGEYLFGHGTGSIKVVYGNVGNASLKIIRDNNVEEVSFLCKKQQ